MSTNSYTPRTLEHLEELIVTAATDRKFRDELVLCAAETAKKAASIELEDEDVQLIESIREDLMRFGGNADLHPDDARSWGLGVLVTANARVRKKDWTVHVTSIQRHAPAFAPRKGKTSGKRKGKGKAK
jgi:hypothetical protein